MNKRNLTNGGIRRSFACFKPVLRATLRTGRSDRRRLGQGEKEESARPFFSAPSSTTSTAAVGISCKCTARIQTDKNTCGAQQYSSPPPPTFHSLHPTKLAQRALFFIQPILSRQVKYIQLERIFIFVVGMVYGCVLSSFSCI